MSLSRIFGFGAKKWPGIAKLVEECGEVLQVCGKLMMTDGNKIEHWDGTNLRVKLIEEAADVSAAVKFIWDRVFSPPERVAFNDRFNMKLALFNKWHQEQAA